MLEGPKQEANSTEPREEAVEAETQHVEVTEGDGSGVLPASSEELEELEASGIFNL